MHNPVPDAVAALPYPDELMGALKRTPDLLVAALNRDGPPVESGVITIGKVDPQVSDALFYFHWVCETNDVIDNINIVLSDMRELPSNYSLHKGSPAKRFYLLVRTFFHEFYRFREIFNTFVKAASDRGLLLREDVRLLRNTFHERFSEFIEVRNTLVHDSPVWKGPDHLELGLFASAWEQGMTLQRKDTGDVHDISLPLSTICPKTADILEAGAVRISRAMHSTIAVLVAGSANQPVGPKPPENSSAP